MDATALIFTPLQPFPPVLRTRLKEGYVLRDSNRFSFSRNSNWVESPHEVRVALLEAQATRHFQRSRRHTGNQEGPNRSRDDAVQRKMELFHEGNEGPPLRIIPIGGLGEIGMNCMLVGNYDRYIMIDAGLMFPDYDELGVQKVLPDTSFIYRWRDKIEAVIITHGHEDHIGALPWVIPALDPRTPIYATGFTMQLIRKRMKEHGIAAQGRCKVFNMQSRFQAGAFEIEPIRVTHSIPDCCGLVLRCKDGTIFHTGDWKIDESPMDGKIFDRTALENLSKEGVTLMMSDSTNVLAPGRTTSEADVAQALMRRISSAKGRVITTQFASNVHRLGSIRLAAEATGRKLVFIGMSLRTYLDAAFKDGQAPFDPSLLVKPEDMGAYAPRDLLIVTTGSQAEPRAALNLASYGTCRSLKLNRNDLVLYSAKMIPGNETRVVRMMNRIAELGPTIVQGRGENLHTSGHAYRDELEELLRLVKPQHFLPVHGEYSFLKEHEQLARTNKIRHTTVIKNGEMLGVSPLRNGRVLSSGFSSLGKENLKLMYNDGDKAFGTAKELCVQERMQIALEGLVIASVEIFRDHPSGNSKFGLHESSDDDIGLQGRVRITTRCLWIDRGRLLDTLRETADATLASCWKNSSLPHVEHKLAAALRKIVQKCMNRRPEVIVIATESSTSHFPKEATTPEAIEESCDTVEFSLTNKPVMDGKTSELKIVQTSESKLQAAEEAEEENFLLSNKAAEENLLVPSGAANEAAEEIFPLSKEAAGTALQAPNGAANKGAEESFLLLNEAEDEALKMTNGEADENTQPGNNEEKEIVQTALIAYDAGPAVKRTVRKWSHDETTSLIQLRSNMDDRYRICKTKKAFWLELSLALGELGFKRTPEQCSSMWSYLVKKFEKMTKAQSAGSVSRKQWAYLGDIQKALSQGTDPIRGNQ